MRIKLGQKLIDKIRNKKKKITREIESQPVYSVPYTQPKNSYKTLVCPTGFGHSGSGTLLDYLAEFDNTTITGFHDPEFSGLVHKYDASIGEIDLFRCAGGVLDLEKYFGAATYFGDDFAVRLFLHTAEFYYRKGKIFTDYFWELTNKFIEDIIDLKMESTNGFEGLYFLQFMTKRKKYQNLQNSLLIDTPVKYEYLLKELTIEEYQKIAKEYIIKFLKSIESKDFLVCDQILTTSKPETERKCNYFGDFKQVCIYRDPRDIYVTGKTRTDTQWIPKNPKDFVKWFYHRGTPYYLNAKPHPNRIMIRFEDFVLKYDETSKIINKFIGIDEKNHIHKKEYFNPDISIKNIGLYKNYKYQDEIKYIEDNLKEYCYYGENN